MWRLASGVVVLFLGCEAPTPVAVQPAPATTAAAPAHHEPAAPSSDPHAVSHAHHAPQAHHAPHAARPHDDHGHDPHGHAVKPAVAVVADAAPTGSGDKKPVAAPDEDLSKLSAAEIYRRRVLPIVESSNPSSCTECHFGVELRNYLHADQAETFASLRDQGLIDVLAPGKSKLLQFIGRKPEREDELLARVREQEQAAIAAWLTAAVRDEGLLKARSPKTPVGPDTPQEVIRHGRLDRVTASFTENVWSEIGRCVNCHSSDRNARQVKEHGAKMSWIRPGDPAGTLKLCIDQGLIDVVEPEKSLLLQKPTNRVPHGGHRKFADGSRTEQQFLRFLVDFAKLNTGEYRRPEDLPKPTAEVAALTEQHLRIVDLPAGLDGKLLQADLYRREGDGWSKERWGTVDGGVNAEKRQFQNLVAAVAPRGSKAPHFADKRLPGGRYLVRITIDGVPWREVEIDGAWPPGYQPPKIVSVQ